MFMLKVNYTDNNNSGILLRHQPSNLTCKFYAIECVIWALSNFFGMVIAVYK